MPTKGELLGLTAPTAGQVTHLPVMMLDSAGAPVTGVTWNAAGMAVEIAKPGGAFVVWATAVGNAWATTNWAEVGRGLYRIIISGDVAGEAALLNTEGHLAAYVKVTATRGDIFLYKVNPADTARDDQWTDAKAAFVDAAITTRSTYAGADTAGTTTLLTRATEARLAELDAANLPADVTGVPAAVLAATVDFSGATDKTVKQCLEAAWVQGGGKWALAGTTLTLYEPNGTTAWATFTLDSATAPTTRTPA